MCKDKMSILPLSEKDRLKVNAVGLAEKYKCTHQYVSKVLKYHKYPRKGKAKGIIDDAIEIIEKYKAKASE